MIFLKFWASDSWPNVQEDYNRLLNTEPCRQRDGATGRTYAAPMYAQIASQSEARNVTCNLTWTPPAGNTKLQEGVGLPLVENVAMEVFVQPVASGEKEALTQGTSKMPEDDPPVFKDIVEIEELRRGA